MLLEGSFVLLSFLQALRGWRPDIIFSTSPSLPACVPVAILRSLYSCPVVLNLQDILPEAAVQTGLLSNPLGIRVFEALEKFAYYSATKISVITDGFVDNLTAKGVPAEKITCISNWVDVNFIRPLPKANNAFRKAHQLDNKFVVLYSGNIARTQGVRTIIRAADHLKDHSDITFVIVGEASQLAELDELRQELGVNNILMLPFTPREKLPEMLAAADVALIMQKRQMVGFNMPSKTQILLASGRPIIASVPDSGTTASAIRKSGGGVVVEPENPSALAKAIVELYNNPDKIDTLGKEGRKFAVANYSFNQAVDRYESLFQKVAPQPSPIMATEGSARRTT